MITVFYDGKCGLCSKEIDYYRVVAPSKVFNWQDVTETQEVLKAHGIGLSDALRLLHAVDGEGNVHIGVDAFLLIWRQLSGWRWLARLVSLPIVCSLAGLCYTLFANWRFKRLKHCQLAARRDSLSVIG